MISDQNSHCCVVLIVLQDQKYNQYNTGQWICCTKHSRRIALMTFPHQIVFSISTRNRPDNYRERDTWIFSPLLYLPMAIGMSYGTFFSDCKYIFQIRVSKTLASKNQFGIVFPIWYICTLI
jgi:hypothetical protein